MTSSSSKKSSPYNQEHIQRLLQWQKILKMSQELETLAQKQQWTAFIQQHENRDKALKDFFAIPIPEGIREKIKKELDQILEMERIVLSDVKLQQEELSNDLLNMNKHRKGISAYHKH